MAGAWAESGSLPSIYFEVFEWTEARTLPPKYKLRVSKPPALQPIRYTPRFPFSRLALYSPLPRELLVRTPHSTPSTSTPAYTRIHALRSLSGLRFSPCWAPSRPPRSSPRPRWLRSIRSIRQTKNKIKLRKYGSNKNLYPGSNSRG